MPLTARGPTACPWRPAIACACSSPRCHLRNGRDSPIGRNGTLLEVVDANAAGLALKNDKDRVGVVRLGQARARRSGSACLWRRDDDQHGAEIWMEKQMSGPNTPATYGTILPVVISQVAIAKALLKKGLLSKQDIIDELNDTKHSVGDSQLIAEIENIILQIGRW